MIILASAIILSISSGDIRGKANEAVSSNDMSAAKEIVALARSEWELYYDELSDEHENFGEYAMGKLKAAGVKTTGEGSVEVIADGTIYTYPKIPEGFVASNITTEDQVSEGLVIYEGTDSVKDDIDAQTTRNQFVWVPVNNINDLSRKDWGKGIKAADFTNKILDYDLTNSDEIGEYEALLESVKQYKGFYIAHYEAGLPEGVSSEVAPSETGVTEANYGQLAGGLTIPMSIKGAEAWYIIPWDSSWQGSGNGSGANNGCVKVARNAYNSSNSVVSHLIYGTEWDAALKFIAKTDPVYPTNSAGKGWINNYPVKSTGTDIDTNASNMLKNIYDMAGNMLEWTMEIYEENETYSYRVLRGGDAEYNFEDYSAAYRERQAPLYGSYHVGFRVALYLK